jgi:hypothetical protein
MAESVMLAISSDAATEYGDAWLVLYELESVVAACDRLLRLITEKSQDYLLLESLSTMALIKYVRCFGTGKRIGLREDDLLGLPGDPIGVHRYFKDLRDKHIAHSVNPLEQVRVGVILAVDGSVEALGHIAGRSISMSGEQTRTLKALAAATISRLRQSLDSQHTELLKWAQAQPSGSFAAAPARITIPDHSALHKPRG